MKKYILIIFVSFITCCVSSGPINNAEFDSGGNLSDLQGVYRNKGDAGEGTLPIYLSRVIWADDKELVHENIDTIEVLESENNVLIVKAMSEKKLLKEEQFQLGKDFLFENGSITIDREGGVAGFKGGEPMLGLYYGSTSLGLDQKGHGKLRSSGAAVGMVYLFLPLALGAQDDVRFERIR